MKRGFTLIELLVVIGIMGLLGASTVGGYRAMVRAMEERGAMQNVNAFIRAAYQRAQIDRQPVVVYFWNETHRSKTDDASEIVVGKAVAVRRFGRISRKDGSVLVDEFADLDQTYAVENEDEGSGGGGGSSAPLIDLYPMDNVSSLASASSLRRSQVRPMVVRANDRVQFLSGPKSDESDESGEIPGYGFYLQDSGGVTWKQGMSYGFEFQRLELPHGYIFGTSHSSDAGNPVVGAGTLVFDVGLNNNNGLNTGGVVGRNSIQVSALRQKGTVISAEKIGDSDQPDRRM